MTVSINFDPFNLQKAVTGTAAAEVKPSTAQIETPTTVKGWLYEFWLEWCRQGTKSLLLLLAAFAIMWLMGLFPGRHLSGGAGYLGHELNNFAELRVLQKKCLLHRFNWFKPQSLKIRIVGRLGALLGGILNFRGRT